MTNNQDSLKYDMRLLALRATLRAFAMIVGACASATKRLEQGQELEQLGRTAHAARRYIDVLHKVATLAAARRRLAETGTGSQALEFYKQYVFQGPHFSTVRLQIAKQAKIGLTPELRQAAARRRLG